MTSTKLLELMKNWEEGYVLLNKCRISGMFWTSMPLGIWVLWEENLLGVMGKGMGTLFGEVGSSCSNH